MKIARRDVSGASEWAAELKNLIKSNHFHCEVAMYPQYKVGLLRIEYTSNSEKEIWECDLKLTTNLISFLETKGNNTLQLSDLEFGPPWFHSPLCIDCGKALSDEIAHCYCCGRTLCKECVSTSLCSSCEERWRKADCERAF